jgi:15-cis-phytoene synthase
MMHLFHRVSQHCSRITTREYSTSFASSICLLNKDFRAPIYNLYGFVRWADEIVDTFHGYDRESLLAGFKAETFAAIRQGLSLNPILHSLQLTVRKHGIELSLIESFFHSMEMDLADQCYDRQLYETYVYGSAEVVGLMCLQIFCEGDRALYDTLQPYARRLGAAFQKVNFLRDLRADHKDLHRCYFPGLDIRSFNHDMKRQIEEDILKDFEVAAEGIAMLPLKARFGVYVAYKYYLSLFDKIRNAQPAEILESRVRIPNYRKLMILVRAGVKNQLHLIKPSYAGRSDPGRRI